MNHPTRSLTTFLLALLVALRVGASVFVDVSTDHQVARSVAVLRGTVLKTESFLDSTEGCIYTRAWIQVDEVFKGRCPPVLLVVHSGGVVGKIGQMDGLAPQLVAGEERLFLLARRKDGTLTALNGNASAVKLRRARGGGFVPEHAALLREARSHAKAAGVSADVTDQAAQPPTTGTVAQAFGSGGSSAAPAVTYTNLLQFSDSFNFSARFVDPDRALPLHYMIDGEAMPVGISSNQALTAVQNAFKAWSNVTALQFVFDGWTNLGNSAASMNNLDGSSRFDGRIRIQLHNTNGTMFDTDTLGRGGIFANPQRVGTNLTTWGSGGNVCGNEFLQTYCGFVVLNHTNVNLQNTNRLAEVLCHEIGHVLSLAHTTAEIPAATDTPEYKSIMYYLVHAVTNGAYLDVWDGPDIRQVYPVTNTPPYLPRRVMDIVIGTNSHPTNAGVNQIQLRGYDLQGTAVTVVTNQHYDFDGVVFPTYGVFALVGDVLSYAPTNPLVPFGRLDPSSPYAFHDRVFARCSDGTNASAFVSINIISYAQDSWPSNKSDGLPDY
ncbi:MAG: matrixin family metalloprotease, partial [Burkholderiales bacterium]